MSLQHPGTLHGTLVDLEPLHADHRDGLAAAVEDGEVWRHWYTQVPTPEAMGREIERRLELWRQGSMLPFAARRISDGALLGMTTFANIDHLTPRVEIGYTWNAAGASGTGTNPDAKLLLLTHAFETWGCAAVEFRTDWHNRPSRAAIERLGAKQDGVLRAHQIRDGYVRDTVVYSIVRSEWAGVRLGLLDRVARHARAGA